jgi:hypothetical protein
MIFSKSGNVMNHSYVIVLDAGSGSGMTKLENLHSGERRDPAGWTYPPPSVIVFLSAFSFHLSAFTFQLF